MTAYTKVCNIVQNIIFRPHSSSVFLLRKNPPSPRGKALGCVALAKENCQLKRRADGTPFISYSIAMRASV
jgi:hypothetical protein